MISAAFQDYGRRVVENCGKVIVGKDEVIEQVLIAFLCGGHVLLEDVPGTGKTMLLRSFAKTIGGDFRRIQFTPDLMPADLTGISFYDQKEGAFRFRPGPLFGSVILADEINRATPRTQSALLEAMEERQVTVDGETRPMAHPFLVMATQNPLENYGTFPLPEAQIDRFFMRLSMGYMSRKQELAVLGRRSAQLLVEELEQVVTREETLALMDSISSVAVSEAVANYIMDIVEQTRSGPVCGVSTRGAIALYRASQVRAALSGREYVIPEDVKRQAVPVLAHRLSAASRQDGEQFIADILGRVSVPTESV